MLLKSLVHRVRVQAAALPLIDKGEFSIHGVARYELGGLDLDLSVELGSRVGVDSPHRHQAAEVGAVLLVCLALSLRPQLTGGPAAHVAGAVDRAVLLRLCGAHATTRVHMHAVFTAVYIQDGNTFMWSENTLCKPGSIVSKQTSQICNIFNLCCEFCNGLSRSALNFKMKFWNLRLDSVKVTFSLYLCLLLGSWTLWHLSLENSLLWRRIL